MLCSQIIFAATVSDTHMDYVIDYTGTLDNTDKEFIRLLGNNLYEQYRATVLAVIVNDLDDIDLTMYEDMVYRSISTNELIVALVYCTSDSSIHPIYPISWEDKLSSALPNVGDSAFSNIITVSYSSICSQIKLIKELSLLAFITPLLCIVMLIIICEVIKRINTRR